jgi:Gpi18-like mannosyltransferase
MGDLLQYRTWMRTLVGQGLAAAYWPPPSDTLPMPIDYPPLFPGVLWLGGRVLAAVSPGALAQDRVLDFAIRLPLCAALLLMGLLVYRQARCVNPAAAEPALACVVLNPALIFDTAYWGQADALCALFMMAPLVSIGRGRVGRAGAAAAAAVLTKPLALPLLPLLVYEMWRRGGWTRVARGVAAGLAVAGLAFLPFVWIGRASAAARDLAFQLEAMPYVSVNAHNLWWLVGRGIPWTLADVRPAGLLTLRAWSLVLVAAFYAATLAGLRRSRDPRTLPLAAASTMFGFFVLSTHMHENHLFFAVALFALAGITVPRVRVFLWLTSAVLFANMLLHDPFLTHLARRFTPGPHLQLPQQILGLGPAVVDHLVRHGYAWAVEESRGDTSLVGLIATLLNAQVLLLVFAAWLWVAYRRRGFDAFLEGASAPLSRRWAAAALTFVVATGVPFLYRAVRFPEEHFFLLQFGAAETHAPFADGVGLTFFEIGGDGRPTLYAHPPAEIRYRLTIPPRARLRFGVALKPEVWSPDKGDGVEFQVCVDDGVQKRTLSTTYVDPKSRPEDRRWRDVDVDLSELAGRAVSLSFLTNGGPAGNTDFDWAGFSDPTLVRR